MKLYKGIEDVHDTEAHLARELYGIAKRHTADPDVAHMARTLAHRCAEHLRQLAPLADAYGASAAPKDLGPPSGPLEALRRTGSALASHSELSGDLLLADLRKLYLAAHDAEISWTVLLQGARAARDADLIEVAQTCQQEAQYRWQWIRTRIKESSPQLLAAAP